MRAQAKAPGCNLSVKNINNINDNNGDSDNDDFVLTRIKVTEMKATPSVQKTPVKV